MSTSPAPGAGLLDLLEAPAPCRVPGQVEAFPEARLGQLALDLEESFPEPSRSGPVAPMVRA